MKYLCTSNRYFIIITIVKKKLDITARGGPGFVKIASVNHAVKNHTDGNLHLTNQCFMLHKVIQKKHFYRSLLIQILVTAKNGISHEINPIFGIVENEMVDENKCEFIRTGLWCTAIQVIRCCTIEYRKIKNGQMQSLTGISRNNITDYRPNIHFSPNIRYVWYQNPL